MKKLIRPVYDHKITSPYGWRVLNGVKEFHHGIDYVSKSNTKVFAIADGIVIYDKDDYNDANRWNLVSSDSLGNLTIIRHYIDGVSYYIRYVHLKENYVQVGQQIKQGDCIGKYGNVGYSFGKHLHIDAYTLDWKKANIQNIMVHGLKANKIL